MTHRPAQWILPFFALTLSIFVCTCLTTELWDRSTEFPWLDDASRCDLIHLDERTVSLESFVRSIMGEKPIVFRPRSGNNDAFRELCQRDSLSREYGHLRCILSTANTHSYEKKNSTIGQYLRDHVHPQDLSMTGEETWYLFGDHATLDSTEWDAFLSNYQLPTLLPPQADFALSFGIGGDGTGVPFHTHGAVFAQVLYGKKIWLLAPPGPSPSFDPNELSFLRYQRYASTDGSTHASSPSITECVLDEGEVLYLPSNWWHMTLNVGDTVFVSTFFMEHDPRIRDEL